MNRSTTATVSVGDLHVNRYRQIQQHWYKDSAVPKVADLLVGAELAAENTGRDQAVHNHPKTDTVLGVTVNCNGLCWVVLADPDGEEVPGGD